jgi:ubiquitin carboxyl-terminal hydrolase L5
MRRRDIDKLVVDISLKDDVVKHERKMRAAEKAPSKKKRKRRKITMDTDYDENGFHFIAYAPALGSVWKMDGMEASPRKIGDMTEGSGWLFVAVADLQAQMQSATASGLEFSLLSLVAKQGANDSAVEVDTMRLAREDWGPFISHMVQLHAGKGDIRVMMQK